MINWHCMSRIVLHGETAKHIHISNYATRKNRTRRHCDVSDDWKHSCEVVSRAGNMTHLSCDPWPTTTQIHSQSLIYYTGMDKFIYEMTMLNKLFYCNINKMCAVLVNMQLSVFYSAVMMWRALNLPKVSFFERKQTTDTTFSRNGNGSWVNHPCNPSRIVIHLTRRPHCLLHVHIIK